MVARAKFAIYRTTSGGHATFAPFALHIIDKLTLVIIVARAKFEIYHTTSGGHSTFAPFALRKIVIMIMK